MVVDLDPVDVDGERPALVEMRRQASADSTILSLRPVALETRHLDTEVTSKLVLRPIRRSANSKWHILISQTYWDYRLRIVSNVTSLLNVHACLVSSSSTCCLRSERAGSCSGVAIFRKTRACFEGESNRNM